MSISRVRAALAAGALAAAAAAFAGGASAQEVCISPAAKSALAQCPAGVTKPAPGKKKEVTLKAPPPAAPKAAPAPRTPDSTQGQGPRDTRRIRQQARSYQLLVTEIQQLETLLAVTPAAAPDRPGLAEHTRVKNAWADPEQAVKKLEAVYPAEDERARHLGKTLTAVGESLFFFAEQKRAEVDRLRFPEYKGSGERDDVLRHVGTKVADWVKKKRAAIEAADREYRKIANLQPAPPPRWTVAGAAKVGQMWSRFVAEFRAAPIPREWKQNGPHPTIPDLTWEEIRLRYYAEVDLASEPQKQKAKAAFEGCLSLAVKHQHFDEDARACEVWLSKNYGDQYHLVDELRGAPSRVAEGIGDRARPVDVGGAFVTPEARREAEAKPSSSGLVP